jgi:hypothetical protein
LHVRLNRQKITSGQTKRGLWLLALVCILMMPLQFKGGAAESHPHAFFQFWSDAEIALHHHGFDEDSGDDSHNQHAHEHPSAPLKRNVLAAQDDGHSPIESSVGPPGRIGIGQVAGFAMNLFLAALFASADREVNRLGAHASLLGRSVLPPVPPPRLSGRFELT